MTTFINLNPYLQALIAGSFTFFITALGSSIVFLFKKPNKLIMDIMLAISAGVMLAATNFSLLNPAIEQAQVLNYNAALVVSLGILSGGILLFIADKILNNKFLNNTKSKRTIMLTSSITLHNIPEGLSIGVAFASASMMIDGASIGAAICLALGIGLQNFPEGSAISLPLRRDGYSRTLAFIIGALSALVEPISALIGVALLLKVKVLLPFLLSFAAGAMIYVATGELIPESLTNNNKKIMTFFILIGFIIMMFLDISFA